MWRTRRTGKRDRKVRTATISSTPRTRYVYRSGKCIVVHWGVGHRYAPSQRDPFFPASCFVDRFEPAGRPRRYLFTPPLSMVNNIYAYTNILIDDYDKNVRLFKEHGGITIHHLGDLSKTLKSLEDLKNVHSNRTSNRSRTQTTGTRS